VMQSTSKKRRLSSKAKTPPDSSTPRGVVRKLLKHQRPQKPTHRGSTKKVVACRGDEDAETTTGEDAGTAAVSEQNKNTRTPGGTVSSATKLKLAAFSAADIGVCRSYLFY